MKEINVVGAAIKEGNKVLAAQRSEYMKNPLKWEFAGGKIEADETPEQALIRELWEELGIKIQVLRFLAVGYSIDRETKIVLHVYEAKVLDGVPAVKEHKTITWVDIDKIMELDWAEADIPACKKLTELYGHKSNL